MTCHPFRTAGGRTGFICTEDRSRRRCVQCGKAAGLLCDWKVNSRRSGTCDKPVCSSCTSSPTEGKDLCPEHARLWAQYPPKMGGRHG
jgi:hypothetical protein